MAAEIKVEDNATETVITTNSTDFTNKVQVTVFDSDISGTLGLTPDHTNDHITADVTADYEITCKLSFFGGSNDTYSGAIFKNNGASQISTRFTRKLGTGGDVGSASISSLARLTAGDTVEVWVQCENATDNLTVTDCTLMIRRAD